MHRFLVFLLALLLSQTAAAQMLSQRPVSQNPVSPADMTERLPYHLSVDHAGDDRIALHISAPHEPA